MLHLLRQLVKEAIMSHHRIARFEVRTFSRLQPGATPPRSETTKMFGIAAAQGPKSAC